MNESGGDDAAAVPAGQRVAGALRERIMEGRLTPGTQLRETALATEFAVARHTLRAALRLLEHEGLIAYKMHKGAVVKTLSTDDVREIYRIRRVLEITAVEQSSTASDTAMDRIERAVAAAEDAVNRQDWGRVGTASLRFHQALVELLGSHSIDRFFQGVLAQLRLAFATMRDEAEWQAPWVPRDREIGDLVRGGHRERARALLLDYLDDSERGVLDVVRAGEMDRLPRHTRTR